MVKAEAVRSTPRHGAKYCCLDFARKLFEIKIEHAQVQSR
jgi:hypothetical protein